MLSRPSDFNTDYIKMLADMLRKKAYRDGYEQGFKALEKENEQLKKNAIVWHKVICFDEPDENGYITASVPVDEGKDYLVLLKNKSIAIDRLTYNDVGYIFEDFEWDDIEAWAELPEVKE